MKRILTLVAVVFLAACSSPTAPQSSVVLTKTPRAHACAENAFYWWGATDSTCVTPTP